MFTEPVVYVDIETNGGNVERGKIIEVAAIRVEDGTVVDTFRTLVNPDSEVPFWITNLTGIQSSDLSHAPHFEDIAYQLHQLLDGAIFIAHNVRFDYSYIKRQLQEAGYAFAPKMLCTVRLSRALYPAARGHSLQKIIDRHGLQTAARHRAYDDALAIKQFAELAYREKGHYAFQDATTRQLKTTSLPPNLDESYLDGVKNEPGVYVFEDEKGVPVYVGKSVTLRKRILSHFSQNTKLNKEMKLSQHTHKLRVIPTKTELEALLLESKMVKELLPVHNIKLRRARSHFVLLKSIDQNGYATITIADKNLARETDLSHIYGLYLSRSKAKAALTDKQKTFDLCPKLLGLEKSTGACFLSQLSKCRGACAGREPAQSYNQRVETALEKTKLEHWPFESAVAIGDDSGDFIVVNNWIIQGYLSRDKDFKPVEQTFDVDTYRILRGYIAQHFSRLTIITPWLPRIAEP